MQGKDHLTGFNPDLLKEPLETANPQINKWHSRAETFNRKRLDMGPGDIQRQFDCSSDDDVGSIPLEVMDNSSIRRTSGKAKKTRRPVNALTELIDQEKKTKNKTINSYKSKINHVLNLINSHSNPGVTEETSGLFIIPNFALVFLIFVVLFSYCLRSLSNGIQSINMKLFNFICCKKHLPFTCMALILYIFLMIVSAVISFLLNPIPKKISEWLIKQ